MFIFSLQTIYILLYEKWKWSHSAVSDSATPWTVAHQAPPSMGFSKQAYWSGVPLPSLGGSFWPRDQTQVSRIAGRLFSIWATTYTKILKLLKSRKEKLPTTCMFLFKQAIANILEIVWWTNFIWMKIILIWYCVIITITIIITIPRSELWSLGLDQFGCQHQISYHL